GAGASDGPAWTTATAMHRGGAASTPARAPPRAGVADRGTRRERGAFRPVTYEGASTWQLATGLLLPVLPGMDHHVDTFVIGTPSCGGLRPVSMRRPRAENEVPTTRSVMTHIASSPPARSRQRLHALVSRGELPAHVCGIIERFFDSYDEALREAGLDPADYDHLLHGFVDRVAERSAAPFVFEPYHRQVTEPFDYYTFGVEFLRPLVDKTRSTVTGLDVLARIDAQLRARENVVLLSNHQTEGDPQA